jgi:hypothetical protein
LFHTERPGPAGCPGPRPDWDRHKVIPWCPADSERICLLNTGRVAMLAVRTWNQPTRTVTLCQARRPGPDWQPECLVIRRSGLGRANSGFDSVPWQQRVLTAMQCPGYGGGESNRGRRGGRRGRRGGRSGRPGRASESLSQVPQLGSGPGPRPVDSELESAVCRTSRCQCQCVTR